MAQIRALTDTGRLPTTAVTHAEEIADAAVGGLPARVTALESAPGITVDTSVGTRVYIGGHLVHADTGWRDMRDLLAFPATAALFRRVNGQVSWVFQGVDSGSASNAALISGFTGIGPSTAGNSRVQRDDLGIRIGFSGTIFIYAPTSILKDTTVATSFSYPVRDGWLTTLPGIPA